MNFSHQIIWGNRKVIGKLFTVKILTQNLAIINSAKHKAFMLNCKSLIFKFHVRPYVKFCFYRQMVGFFSLFVYYKCIWVHLFSSLEKKNNSQYFNPHSLIPLQSPFQCSNRFPCHCCYKGLKVSPLVLYTGKKCNWRVPSFFWRFLFICFSFP